MYFYENGTDTPKDTFGADGVTANSNPVILDGSGHEPDIFGDGTYTVRLESSSADGSLTQWTRDDVVFTQYAREIRLRWKGPKF